MVDSSEILRALEVREFIYSSVTSLVVAFRVVSIGLVKIFRDKPINLDRLELLDEFLSSCAEFDDKEEGSLEEYLQENALASAVDTMEGVTSSAALMTCHSAKGLEFNRVFLVGLEEGLLPHAHSIVDTDAVE